ncbi:MAG: cytochrome-c oxidase, cbb3-type subunit III [Alphaproteobacteria bacterium]
MANPEIDDVTGVETTGHEWDGIKELNKPLPTWWVWVFWVTIIWGIGYTIVYPSWPTFGDYYVKGIWNWHSREAAMNEVKAGRELHADKYKAMLSMPVTELKDKDPELFKFAAATGKVLFADYCAPCHQTNGKGTKGYPNLQDDDWLYGGTIEDINTTIKHGVRSGDEDERSGGQTMPAKGVSGDLTEEQINQVTEYVLSLSGNSSDKAAAESGKAVFNDAGGCSGCHGEDAKGAKGGNGIPGSPDLTDAIWLYGGKKADIKETITAGRGGVMPAWAPRFAKDPSAIVRLTAYVYSLSK